MTMNVPSTSALRQAGQSPWLDFISREILRNGKLQSLIEEFGLLGVTSNPTIFEKSISTGSDYKENIQDGIRGGKTTFEIYDALTLADICDTCDLFLPVYRQTQGEHGFVSLEVLPSLAHEEEATVEEAERLFHAVSRPNVMIKVPATPEGVSAVRRLIGRGININITLMFSTRHYREVAHAYLEGLMDYQARGGDIRQVHSVASVFVSRIDTLVDQKLQAALEQEQNPARKMEIQSLQGKAAVANAKLIYQGFKEILGSEKFQNLREQGANIQKLLWGSTSTKNPNYPDLLYVENLIGGETVNTMPLATLEAFLDHGKVPGQTIEEDVAGATRVAARLKSFGIDLNAVGDELQRQGVRAFSDSFDSLMRTLEKIRFSSFPPGVPASFKVDSKTAQRESIRQKIREFEKVHFIKRLFEKDPSLWKQERGQTKSIENRLGWLHAAEWMLGKLCEVDQLSEEILREGVKDIVLLGMGGSSLAPEVMSSIFRKAKKRYALKTPFLKFHVLDTTDSTAILKVEKAVDLSRTLFIVASKSGTTVETVAQFRYFYEKARNAGWRRIARAGGDLEKQTGRHFIAITDEGSWLERTACEKEFRKIFLNPADIGGRYSALSYFGMVPAALLGIPVREILRGALEFFSAAKKETRVEQNSSVYLGMMLGQLAAEGKDKLTFWMSPALTTFGPWLEQLVAESTGKEGKGILPVEGEKPENPSAYGEDRVFAVMKLKGDSAADLSSKVRAVQKAGFSVLEFEWTRPTDIGAEFLRWEIATCVAGAVLDVNPFDEPNVQESKDNTNRLLAEREKGKKLFEPGKLLKLGSSNKRNPAFHDFFSKRIPEGYIALLSYTERSPQLTDALNRIRRKINQVLKVPVLAGFGPRYLHSIGQFYKGGPRDGLFIEFFVQDQKGIAIPGVSYSFGELQQAQALGDCQALEKKGLEVLAVHLGKNPVTGFAHFERQLEAYFRNQKL